LFHEKTIDFWYAQKLGTNKKNLERFSGYIKLREKVCGQGALGNQGSVREN